MNKHRWQFGFLVVSIVTLISMLNAVQTHGQGREPLSIWANFTASGWMGDGELGDRHIKLLEAYEDKSRPDSLCVKISYAPGPNGWAGIYWQNLPDNWGDSSGMNLSHAGYTKLTFWARGESGKEVVEFKAGGISATGKKYKDSFSATTGKQVLEKGWRKYTIDLTGKNLSSVIGGFCWVASKSGNPQGLTFYLDDMHYER
jgi:hypothetical protein